MDSAEGIAQALAEAWKPTFAVAPVIDVEKAKTYLAENASALDFSTFVVPDSVSFEQILSKMQHFAPGPDGIPFAAWKAAGPVGHRALAAMLRHALSGRDAHSTFNDSIIVFIPKGDEEDDIINGAVRKPQDTRPFSLKNTDNKFICCLINYATKHILTAGISHLQRGFVPKRQLLANVVELDAMSHAYAIAAPGSAIPMLVLFDFAAAFPSISHEWLFLTLHAMQFPIGFINFIHMMYKDNHAYYNSQGCSSLLFQIRRSSTLSALRHAVRLRNKPIFTTDA